MNLLKWFRPVTAELILAGFFWHAPVLAQNTAFNPSGMTRMEFNSNSCAGFYGTPTLKCSPIVLPAYLLKAADNKAVVFITHGSGGLDKRHGDYARQLVENGINAMVLGHWEARGLSKIHLDYSKARNQGGTSHNQVSDVLAAATQMKETPEWREAKFGHIGESIGGSTALNLTRPYLRRAFNDMYGKPSIQLDALVALYASCTDRNVDEKFIATPLLFIHGRDDDDALASECEAQVPWMNGRGGRASIVVLPGQHHDFDAPYRLHRSVRAENPVKCANMSYGHKFILEINGKEYPGTAEGYAQMRKDCIAMTRTGVTTGHTGNPKTGYPEWTAFFLQHLK
jgi:dienelactone hydrolase